MRLRFTWYGIVGVGFLLSFFGIIQMPKDWNAAMTALAPIEAWWATHAVHPSLAAFFAGLLVGTILLPELWIEIKPHIFPPALEPDIAAGEAFKLLFESSKLAYDLVKSGTLRPVQFESHLTEPQKIGSRLRVELADRIHNALADARIVAWGRADGSMPESQISFTD